MQLLMFRLSSIHSPSKLLTVDCRLATKQWRVKDIDPNEARRFGRCPLSPSEVGLILSALGFGNDTRLYIASGEIYGGQSRLAGLRERFPNLVSKVTLNLLCPFKTDV